MTKRALQDELIYEILAVVEEIPEGSVATYGQIARLIGREKNGRQPRGAAGSGLAGAALPVGGGGRCHEG